MNTLITANGYALNISAFSSLPSTNTLLKQQAREGAPEGTVITAGCQTAGRGRMGRSFFSPDGTGLYLSLLLRPSLPPENALLITVCAAVSAAEAVERLSGKTAGIKWVNDIFLDGKKVCGILTEGALSPDGNSLAWAVLGVGVNLFPPSGGFPQEITDTASSVFRENGEVYSAAFREQAQKEFLKIFADSFFGYYPSLTEKEYLGKYRERSVLTGQEISILRPGADPAPATALGIGDDFSLLVRHPDGRTEALRSGDVSVRVRQ